MMLTSGPNGGWVLLHVQGVALCAVLNLMLPPVPHLPVTQDEN